MTKRKKVTLISNVCIVFVLLGLGIAVFTADLANVFISVNAPLAHGDRNNGRVSVMFAICEDERVRDVNDILDRLDGVDATFFISGSWANRNQDTVRRIAKDFEIGNHGFNHRALANLNERDQRNELQSAHTMIRTITSTTKVTEGENGVDVQQNTAVSMSLFLPPHGSFNKRTLRAAESLGYTTVMWSRDARTDVMMNATSGILSGDFILLRPNFATLSVINSILNEYRRQNLTVVSVGNHIK